MNSIHRNPLALLALLTCCAILATAGCSDRQINGPPVEVTYVGNDGVLLVEGEIKILVDALQTTRGAFPALDPDDFEDLVRGAPPFDGIDMVLVTHSHIDHFDPDSVTRFLQNNPGARLIGPPQVTNQLSDSAQIERISLAPGQSLDVDVNGVRVTVHHLSHFNQFGLDFSDVENFAYLFELGGETMVHFGDVAATADNLAGFDFPSEEIDVAFLPTFAEQLSEDVSSVVREQIAPGTVVGLHLLEAMREEEASRVMELYPPNGFAFTEPLDGRDF